jgi:hypothetical protein
LTEGRRRNYFFYAIGEILLLVIGSLLPFTAAEIVNIYRTNGGKIFVKQGWFENE